MSVFDDGYDAILRDFAHLRRDDDKDATKALAACNLVGLLAIAHAIDGLAETIRIATGNNLGHEICMGIRKGLYGADAFEEASLHGVAQQIIDGMAE